MGAQENAELLRSGYEAFSTGDMETVAKLFAPDIRWNISGRSQISGTYTGHDEVFGFFGKLMELTGNTFSVAIHDLLASDDHVVVIVKESGTRNGTSLESDEVHVWHVEDGRATEFWGIP
ncbi:MAG TPA: nuclear transport factor 2 family protein, partial [Acidimicrobiales bacterium]|nr:nuclear transport factor 2 family protein [Acidimicrobiales bacterium]